MKKDELLIQLKNAKNNFILILGSISLFSNEKTYPILDESVCQFGEFLIQFKEVSDMMRNENDRNISCKEFVKSGLRALIKESFELIKDYAINTSQEKILKETSWYQFARIIRNCMSHNFKFEFNDHDKKILPVIWEDKTINISLDNTNLELSFLGYDGTFKLFNQMNLFVVNSLN